MMRIPCLALSLLMFSFSSLHAAHVDTVAIYSAAMKKTPRCVVIVPGTGTRKTPNRFPVVYLLHGWSGRYSNWIMRVPELKQYADEYRVMIVCPDGDYSGWYLDSPVDSSMRYETYIGREVPDYIDAHYATIPDRNARAITGLSMGGHGGLLLGFLHSATFGACGSMSGAVDLSGYHKSPDLVKLLGDSVVHASDWDRYSVMQAVDTPPGDSLAIIIDCGTEDVLLSVNQRLHQKLARLRIPHDYIERPGGHDWKYWRNAVQYQLLFFRNFFIRKGTWH